MTYSMNTETRKAILNKFPICTNSHFYFCSTISEYKSQEEKVNVLIEDGLKELQIMELMVKHNLKHIIQNSFQPLEKKIQLISSIANMEKDFFDQNLDLIENHTFKHNIIIKIDSERVKIVETLVRAMGLDPQSSRSQPLQEILHELIMNAQLSAPQMSLLKKNLDCILKVEKNEDTVAFSMIDYYGSLNVKRFIKKIQTALLVGAREAINYTSIGGAGLGSSIILRNSDSLLMGCIPNKVTRVSVILPASLSEKKLQFLQKSVHIFDDIK